MPARPAGFARVKLLGLRLPDVEEGISWGSPALKTDGQMIACIPTHKSAEPDSLAVRIDFAQRDELLAADPHTYYLRDHYVNYPCVLVRLARIHDDGLQDLLRMAYDYVRARTRRRSVKGPAKATPRQGPANAGHYVQKDVNQKRPGKSR